MYVMVDIIWMGFLELKGVEARITPEVQQSPDARLSWAFVVRGFISMISKV